MRKGDSTTHQPSPITHQSNVAKTQTKSKAAYQRILLKLRGEALMGNRSYGIDLEVVKRIAREVKEVADLGVEIALVVGGGNIARGVQASAMGMDRASAAFMGTLDSVMKP